MRDCLTNYVNPYNSRLLRLTYLRSSAAQPSLCRQCLIPSLNRLLDFVKRMTQSFSCSEATNCLLPRTMVPYQLIFSIGPSRAIGFPGELSSTALLFRLKTRKSAANFQLGM